ncbi:MAG: 50S ribosomal protein L20 [Planctomycetes bacterium]|nr:50S ribosomal protein L20 [Planctomycetota bacterium]
MGRATSGAARHRKKVRILKQARGFRGAPGKRWRLAKEAVIRSGVNAYRDRRLRKRNFRALWITRLTAACRSRGIVYSRFIYGLLEAKIELNRKMMSEIAIASPADFDALVEIAKQHQPRKAVA